VRLICCLGMERGKACPDTVARPLRTGGERGSIPSGVRPRGSEYRRRTRWRTGS
jgi:hypothetical protein